MADNLTITQGAGTTVATDDIAGAHYQKVKVFDGTADSTNAMVVDATGKTYVHSLTQGTVKISGTTETLGVYVSATAGTIAVGAKDGTFAVYFSPSLPTIKGINDSINVYLGATAGTLGVRVEQVNSTVSVTAKDGTFGVYFSPSLPTIKGINDSINVYLGATAGTIGVRVEQVNSTVSVTAKDGTFAVYFSPSVPTVNATFSGSIATFFDPSEPTIKGITNTIRVGDIPGTVAVYFSPSNPSVNATFSSASLEVIPTTGSRRLYDEGYQAQRVLVVGSQPSASLLVSAITDTIKIKADDGTFAIYFSPSLPTIKGINDSIAVYLGATAGTIGVRVEQVNSTVSITAKDGTFAVYFSPSTPAVSLSTATVTNLSSTTVIPRTVSGSVTTVSTSGSQLVAPDAGNCIKVFAIALTTTAQVQTTVKLTNGSGAAPTEYWRYALQEPTAGVAGANLAVSPPGYLFATASNTTLCLTCDNASLVHYSIGYFKESA